MPKKITLNGILFEVIDVFGKKVRTTKIYWTKIKTSKHTELKFDYQEVKETLINPDEVYQSVQDSYIKLFYKKYTGNILVVVVKYLNGDGFVVTSYQTSKHKRKGEKIWPK